MEPLIDPFGRRVKDLRISITDRCNFRCTYCMPEEGMDWLPRDELLTYEEQARIARVCVERFGFEAIRLTGGEPTLRAHLPRLIAMLAPLGVDLALTTNGVKLPEMAHDLAAAGLSRINVSLDSLRADTFLELTRRDDLDRVLAGIDAALDAGLDPVKVNAVVIRGVNDDEVVDLAAFGRDHGVGMRFIEFMPLDADGEWSDGPGGAGARDPRPHRRGVPARAVTPRSRGRTSSRPTRYRYPTAAATSASSRASPSRSASDCDRVRVTAEGKLPHLPVRARGVRPARDPARDGGSRRRPRGRDRRVPSAPSGPGTASVRSTSCARTAR